MPNPPFLLGEAWTRQGGDGHHVMVWTTRDAAARTPMAIAPIASCTHPTVWLKRVCAVVCIYIDTGEAESGLRPSGASVAGSNGRFRLATCCRR